MGPNVDSDLLSTEVPRSKNPVLLPLIVAIVTGGLGVAVGMMLSQETPETHRIQIQTLQKQIATQQDKIASLQREIVNTKTFQAPQDAQGKLPEIIRKQHLTMAQDYARLLRQKKRDEAADLVIWFIERWNALLNFPEPEDRTTRRARLLADFVSGMSELLDPADFVAWQSEFLSFPWLAEIAFDQDSDGLPGTLQTANPKDSYTDASPCTIAMALNQSLKNTQFLVARDLDCKRPPQKVSVFLAGKTLKTAVSKFTQALRKQGYLVVDKKRGGVRRILFSAPR